MVASVFARGSCSLAGGSLGRGSCSFAGGSLGRVCVIRATARSAPRLLVAGRGFASSVATTVPPPASSSSSSSSLVRAPATRGEQETPALVSELDQASSQEMPALVYELDQSYKFRWTSRLGIMYTCSWMFYVGADVFYLNTGGPIASNAGIVGLIGATSFAVGSYLLTTFGSRTVARLELLPSDSDGDTLRVTSYTALGAEKQRDLPLADVVALTSFDDKSLLKQFASRDDPQRPYHAFVEDQANVHDRTTFDLVVHGIRPPTTSRRLIWATKKSRKRNGSKKRH